MRLLSTALIPLLSASAWLFSHSEAAETWAFTPEIDTFSDEALLDLRSLNEEQAGQTGWLRVDEHGDFIKGDGSSIRFWALCTRVDYSPYHERPLWKHMAKMDLKYHAKWLAKRGVNMVRCGAEINPDPKTSDLDTPNMAICEWTWKAVGAMADEGIYSIISPYWAYTVKSDDKKWGTDWNGNHNALVFFDERMQQAYKNWLKVLFKTPSKHLGGKTLSEFPALASFTIQNEDTLLFWTVNRIQGPAAEKLGKLFGDWAINKYGSIDKAYAVWGEEHSKNDKPASGILPMMNLWNMTVDGRKGKDVNQRVNDQLQFWTELMYNFNKEIKRYVNEDLNCPVLVNGGNWKSGDPVLLDDAEPYSYDSTDVIAANRYFSGQHNGAGRGWAIFNGDEYTNKSATTNGALSLPTNLKQIAGKPMLITESTWVFPEENAYESSLLTAAYSSLNGVDAVYWNGAAENDWAHPKSANGYKLSQKKWICMTPDQAGQWPGAAFMHRKGLLKRGEVVVHEHRSLESIYTGKEPIITEKAKYDPNRDEGNVAKKSKIKSAISPWAYLVGPVVVTYDSDESLSTVKDIDQYVTHQENGTRVDSITGELSLDTSKGLFTIDAPMVQAICGHFTQNTTIQLSDVSFSTSNSEIAISVMAMDDKPLGNSQNIFIQIGNKCRPTDWKTKPIQIKNKDGSTENGFRVLNYGKKPWQVQSALGSLTINNPDLRTLNVLDMNGLAISSTPLKSTDGTVTFSLPKNAMYVMLTK